MMSGGLCARTHSYERSRNAVTIAHSYVLPVVVDVDGLRGVVAGGETFTVEFKAGGINDTELVEAVACLANENQTTVIASPRQTSTHHACTQR